MLCLFANKLGSWDELNHDSLSLLNHLTWLNVDGNQLSEIYGASLPPRLHTLSAAHNHIKAFPSPVLVSPLPFIIQFVQFIQWIQFIELGPNLTNLIDSLNTLHLFNLFGLFHLSRTDFIYLNYLDLNF